MRAARRAPHATPVVTAPPHRLYDALMAAFQAQNDSKIFHHNAINAAVDARNAARAAAKNASDAAKRLRAESDRLNGSRDDA